MDLEPKLAMRCFNPHSRKTPSGTWELESGELECRSFNPHSRKTPSGTLQHFCLELSPQVSILTRGKPRVERGGNPRVFRFLKFQSSLEENPEWNIPLIPLPLIHPYVSILTRGNPRVEQ